LHYMPRTEGSRPALVRLFVLLVVAGGLGGFVGSVVAAAFGRRALFAGGVLGGLVTSPAAAFLAARFGWIGPGFAKGTAIGAAVGFAAAVAVAVSTLSNPVGPLLSPLLVGVGGLVGYRLRARTSE
jgi:hypothetical protein